MAAGPQWQHARWPNFRDDSRSAIPQSPASHPQPSRLPQHESTPPVSNPSTSAPGPRLHDPRPPAVPAPHSAAGPHHPHAPLDRPWPGLAIDHFAQDRRHAAAPSPDPRHVPDPRAWSRPAPPYGPHSQDDHGQKVEPPSPSMAVPHVSLPPFAAFEDRAPRHHASPYERGRDVASTPPTTTCLCRQLRPQVEAIADAVVRLDDTVQTHHHVPASTRKVDFPKDSPDRALLWILDRLGQLDQNLQRARGRATPARLSQPAALSTRSSDDHSASLSHKRTAAPYDAEDFASLKRQRTGSMADVLHPLPPSSLIRDDRATAAQSTSSGATRQPTSPSLDSDTDMAQPRPRSSGHPPRLLPSPSSLTYSAPKASMPPPTAASVSPPPASHHAPPLMHAASPSTAISQHIADLQRQISLKTLSLQSLQSEHTSLLQKWHRERIRYQAVEKKARVADQEVDELASKNEELVDQVKSLETQLEDNERKREEASDLIAKEKAQWGRMLEMGGKLHVNAAAERQKLVDEIASLEQRVLSYEQENRVRFEKFKRSHSSDAEGACKPFDTSDAMIPDSALLDLPSKGASSGQHSTGDSRSPDMAGVLQTRIGLLHNALREAKLQNSEMEEKTRELLQQRQKLEEVIDMALQDPITVSAPLVIESVRANDPADDLRPTAYGSPWVQSRPVPKADDRAPASLIASTEQPRAAVSPRRSPPQEIRSFEAVVASGGASSPTPAQLGFEVTPSTSSPEELVKALGPVPAPLPPTSIDSSLERGALVSRAGDSSTGRTSRWRPINHRDGKDTQSPRSSPGGVEGLGAPTEGDGGHVQTRRYSPTASSSHSHETRPPPSSSTDAMPPPPRPSAPLEPYVSWRPQ